MEIGTILAVARKEAGLPQKDVADALGISQSYLSDIEANRRSFPRTRVKDLPQAVRGQVASALISEYYLMADELRQWVPQIAEGGEI